MNQPIHCKFYMMHSVLWRMTFPPQILMNAMNSVPVIKYVITQLGPMNAHAKKAMSLGMVQLVKVPLPATNAHSLILYIHTYVHVLAILS